VTAWTFSATDRVFACPAGAALPQANEPSGPDAERGTAIHAYLADVCDHGEERALFYLPFDSPHRADCIGIRTGDIAAVIGAGGVGFTEHAFAYNPVTGGSLELGSALGRQYPDSPGWVCGTMDLVVRYPDGSVTIVDWKTGRDAPYAAESGQLAIAALAVSLPWSLERVTVAIGHIRDDGSIAFDRHEYDEAALQGVAERVRKTWDAAVRAENLLGFGQLPTTTLGAHCKYCPAASFCPSQIALVRRFIGEGDGVGVGGNPAYSEASTPAEVGALWARFEQIKPRLEQAEAALKRAVERLGEVPMADGRRVVTQLQNVRSVNAEKAWPILVAQLGEERAKQIGGVKMTLTQIEAVAANDIGELMNALDHGGALPTKQIVKFAVRKAPRGAAA